MLPHQHSGQCSVQRYCQRWVWRQWQQSTPLQDKLKASRQTNGPKLPDKQGTTSRQTRKDFKTNKRQLQDKQGQTPRQTRKKLQDKQQTPRQTIAHLVVCARPHDLFVSWLFITQCLAPIPTNKQTKTNNRAPCCVSRPPFRQTNKQRQTIAHLVV